MIRSISFIICIFLTTLFFSLSFLHAEDKVSLWRWEVKTGISSYKWSYFLSQKAPVRLPLFYDDASLYRFVSRTTPLSSTYYIPENLVAVSGSHIDEAGRKSFIRKDAKDALLELAWAFEAEFGTPLVVVSAYRSAAYQKRLWDLGRCTDSLCAPPGHSEHQLGLAVDLFDASTLRDFEENKKYRSYIRWLQKNAHLYGWTQSYQKGEKVDEYEIEPWHWRYIGGEMATRLHNLGWSYTEFVRFQEAIQGR
jgi:zinc D-Ala-D-Ala carboxypeptidase